MSFILCLSHIPQSSPFVMEKKNQSDDGAAYEGFCIDLLNALRGKLQFEYELRLRNEIGERRSDGTWSGIIGELTRKVGNTLRLIKYYHTAKPVFGKSVRFGWFFLGRDFPVRTISMETVQAVFFLFWSKAGKFKFATKIAKKKKKGEY